jgi:CrcB protein
VLLVIAAGGALGTPARYAIEEVFAPGPGEFPRATFAINVSGAFALALFLVIAIERFPPSRYVRPFVATGILGAYTTFSTFAVEIVTLGKDGHVPMAVIYAVLSTVVGLAAARTGWILGRRLPVPRRSR